MNIKAIWYGFLRSIPLKFMYYRSIYWSALKYHMVYITTFDHNPRPVLYLVQKSAELLNDSKHEKYITLLRVKDSIRHTILVDDIIDLSVLSDKDVVRVKLTYNINYK